MNFSLWLVTALLGGAVWLLGRSLPARKPWRLAGKGLGALAWIYPLSYPVAHGLVRWIYQVNPAGLGDRLMASRTHLAVAHYLSRADQALNAGLLGLTGLLLLWVSGQALRLPQVRAWLRTPVLRALLGGILALLLLFIGYNLWVEYQFRRPHPVFYDDCHKIWGHRGHPEPPDIPENTIASYTRAFDLGAPGVEMDVRYDVERHEYFIGRYDRGQAPPPGQRLTLAEVFEAVGDRGYFWLDTKTIHYLTPDQARQAASDMAQLLDRFGLRQRAIIESDTPENLVYFAQAGLHTSYWIFNIDEEAFPRQPWALWQALIQIKQRYISGGFSAISLDRRFYTPMVAAMLSGARIHLFTVDDPGELRRLAHRDEVKVILTNTTYYDITACP